MEEGYFPENEKSGVENLSPIQAQLITEHAMLTLKNEMLGKHYDQEKRIWVIDGDPIINEKGANKYLSAIKIKVNSITIQANHPEDRIGAMMKSYGQALTIDIAKNRENYEITNPALLKRMIFDFCYDSLSRSKDGFLANLFKEELTIRQEQKFIDAQKDKEKKGKF